MAILRLPRLPQLPAALKTVRCDPAALCRVSGHSTGEPYFGRANTYRFDDPHPQAAARFGTCYLGASLAVALAETLLHDRKPIRNHFIVGLTVIQARFVIRLTGETLVLADLTGAALRKLGGHAGLSGTSSYQTTKAWSAAIHAHPDEVDGIRHTAIGPSGLRPGGHSTGHPQRLALNCPEHATVLHCRIDCASTV